MQFPKRIICMTEESVETLFALGEGNRIVGVSAYVERPPEAKNLPTISAFTHANINKIKDLNPDLVLGYSDIQKDIAAELIGLGIDVWISNHRSLEETLDYIEALGRFVGVTEEGRSYRLKLEKKLFETIELTKKLQRRHSVYLEEWPGPMISGIRYFSELVEACGGDDIFVDRREEKLAKGRFCSWEEVCQRDPEVIFGCWCGQPLDIASIKARPNASKLRAVKNGNIFELPPEIFLQPGPALFEAGLDHLMEVFQSLK